MKAAIIEDEPTARKKIRQLFRELVPGGEIIFESGSIKETFKYLEQHGEPDLMFVDIQLSDGLSLNIFRQRTVKCPLIFTTAFDHYTLEAFSLNGIDYLLKPIKKGDFIEAIEKYRNLKQHFTGNLLKLIETFETGEKRTERIMVKKGIEFVSIPTRDIAFFYTEFKVVFLIDKHGIKYIVDRPIYDLEKELDHTVFYRINRQYLVNINAVASFRSYDNGKLLVKLKSPTKTEDIIVSQEKARDFREWMAGRKKSD